MPSKAHALTPMADAAERYLGAARVTRVAGRSMEVELDDGRCVAARLAVAFPYGVIRNDEALVIGDDDTGYFVIGILKGRGVARLHADELGVRAEGTLRLHAAHAIQLRSRALRWLSSRRVALRPHKLVCEARELSQRIDGQLAIAARDLDQVVGGTWTAQAVRACLKVAKEFYLNGKVVRIG